jgi:UDP-3-O-[3-hydroxymyristoyl] N-acetylglucosamine deacetylase
MKQQTIRRGFVLKGIGLHSGRPAEITVTPAPSGSGLIFVVNGERIPAVIGSLTGTRRGTSLKGVAVVEHFLSAAAGLNIDNLKINVSGPELPILDGSALPFASALEEAGIVQQEEERHFFDLSAVVELVERETSLKASPYNGFKVEFMVKFEGFGEQSLVFDADKDDYLKEIAPARTFGFLEEAETLKKQGLALGASLDNALILDKNGYVNQPRFVNELVRHKILDLIGDLALLGRPLHAALRARGSGHKLNTDLVRLLTQPGGG